MIKDMFNITPQIENKAIAIISLLYIENPYINYLLLKLYLLIHI